MPLNFVRQDLSKMTTDAIVVCEGNDLSSHGQVGLAIAKAAGEEYQKACENLGFCDTGAARITKGYKLSCKYVIHTVGPKYEDGHKGEPVLLKSCYEKSLQLAKDNNCKSIAFPIISSGGYGFPKDLALKIAIDTINSYLSENDIEVYLVVYDRESTLLSENLCLKIKEYIDNNYVDEQEKKLSKTFRGHLRKTSNSPVAYSNFEKLGSSCLQVNFNSSVEKLEDIEIKKLVEENNKSQDDKCKDKLIIKDGKICTQESINSDLESSLKLRDESFQEMLFRLIKEKKLKPSTVYTRANISKSHFSKIRCNPEYKPKKETVFAFAVALELDIDTTNELMKKAGYAISHSFVLDTIVEFFILNKNYSIMEINWALFDHDQPLLGEKAV